MQKIVALTFIYLFIGLFQVNAQVNYFKPSNTPYVEPDSIQKAGSGISQSVTIRINEFMASNNATYADESNEFEDWVEIHNYGDDAVDLNGMYVSDDAANPLKFQLTASGSELVMPSNTFLILWADDDESDGANHLNFKLSAGGESIILTGSDQVLIDQYHFGVQTTDISEGLVPGTSDWNFYTLPTPNSVNGTTGLSDKLPEPEVSVAGGLYRTSQSISINYPDNNATLHYTTDGKVPEETDDVWSNGLSVSATTTLRVKAFRSGYLPSNTATHTYVFDENFTLDIISIQSDPASFFGASGIYDNEGSGLEKEIHLEYFKATGELAFEVNAGIKIHSAKGHSQKSLRLYTRPEYGDNEINYKIFDDKNVDIFKRLILRNGSNDSQTKSLTHFRDGMYHQLFRDATNSKLYSAYRPVHVYLNGLYWGIYNLRERQDKYYTKYNFGHENVDLLERTMDTPSRTNAIAGSFDEYNVIDNFIKNNDMSIDANYQIVKDNFDIESYIDYYAFGIFSGNRDWIENNTKWWKPKEAGHKWQWIMWDVEFGLGTYNVDNGQPEFDSYYMSIWWGGWGPKPGTLTYVLRNLVTNKEFREQFANRYADLMNTTLKEENFVQKIDEAQAVLAPDFDKQIARWGKSTSTWNGAIKTFRDYVNARPEHCRQHVINRTLSLYTDSTYKDTVQTIYVDVQPTGAGKIKINTIKPDTYPWNGIYFNSVPIQVTAIPNPGYQFSHWSEDTINADWFSLMLLNDATFTAFFEA
jgi:hypothetical protein